MKRVMYVQDSLNKLKYVLKKEYAGHGIYQHMTPTGYLVCQDWLILNEDGLIIQIPSYNDICLGEIYDAIDVANEEGEYDFKVMVNYSYTDPVYVVHPNGKARI